MVTRFARARVYRVIPYISRQISGSQSIGHHKLYLHHTLTVVAMMQ